jgi:uncharacterized protein YggT (Ycf19 family)
MRDSKPSYEEQRRAQRRDPSKPRLEHQVRSELGSLADRPVNADAIGKEHGKPHIRQNVRDLAEDHPELHQARDARLVSQVADFLFAVVYALLGLRIVLVLAGAAPDGSLMQWISAVTDPLYAPFQSILPSAAMDGGYTFALSLAFTMAMYGVLHALVASLIRMVASPRT